LVGRKEFYGLDLTVNPTVLIPRPETELLVELALERKPQSVLDLGTGSGAVALALKHQRPACRVTAVDADLSALLTAKRNAVKLNLEVDFRHGCWCEPVAGRRFDVIVSNPPYIADGDPHLPDLRHEPRAALLGGTDGLDAFRALVPQLRAHLKEGGWVLLEHGMGQESAVRQLLAQAGFTSLKTWPDLSGIGRVTGGKR
jgi:release factor glutamine methyltransferase